MGRSKTSPQRENGFLLSPGVSWARFHSWMAKDNNNLQAFQLIVLARYLLGVPKP